MIYTDLPQIILCTVLGIIALFITALVLVFVVRVRLTLELNEELSLWVSFMGIKHRILPQKPKKYKIRDYTPKKIARRDAIAAKKAAKRAAAKQKKKAKKAKEKKLTWAQRRALRAEERAKRPYIPDVFDLLITVVETFLYSFFGHAHFHVARIRIKVGADDASSAALLCTYIRLALDPILTFINCNTNLHGLKHADIDISPDYLSEEIKYDVKLAFSMNLVSFIYVILRTGIPGLVGWLDIQPPAPSKDEGKEEETAQKAVSSEEKAKSTNTPSKK